MIEKKALTSSFDRETELFTLKTIAGLLPICE